MDEISLGLRMTAPSTVAAGPVRRWVPCGAPGWRRAWPSRLDSGEVAGRALFCRYEILAHSRRVQAYAARLARGLGLAGRRLDAVRQGALLHDIGKFLLPAAILGKRGALTPIEQATVRLHPMVGDLLLQDRVDLAEARDIVRAHHERFDGTGYPRGLAGEAIPLGARVVAVADVFAAVTSPRSYHLPLSIERARETLARDGGTHFDPAVIGAFLGIPAAEWAMLAPDPTAGPRARPFPALAGPGILARLA
jgi:putative nucleotidyltransferase with HDIG domain